MSHNNNAVLHPTKHAASSGRDEHSGNKRPKAEPEGDGDDDENYNVHPVSPPPSNAVKNDEAIPEQFKDAMTDAMQKHFGHSMFRPGQLAVLHSLLGGRGKYDGTIASTSQKHGVGKDTCVFWATG